MGCNAKKTNKQQRIWNILSFKCGLRDTRYCKQGKKYISSQICKNLSINEAHCPHSCMLQYSWSRLPLLTLQIPTNAGSTDTNHTGTLPYRLLSDCVKVCDTVATLSLLVGTVRSSRSALADILPHSVSYKLITQSCNCNPFSKLISPTFLCLYHIVRFPASRKIPLKLLKYYLQWRHFLVHSMLSSSGIH
jgi:hypothetical protein